MGRRRGRRGDIHLSISLMGYRFLFRRRELINQASGFVFLFFFSFFSDASCSHLVTTKSRSDQRMRNVPPRSIGRSLLVGARKRLLSGKRLGNADTSLSETCKHGFGGMITQVGVSSRRVLVIAAKDTRRKKAKNTRDREIARCSLRASTRHELPAQLADAPASTFYLPTPHR